MGFHHVQDRRRQQHSPGGLSTSKRGPPTDLAAEVGNVSLDTRAGYVGREHSLAFLPRLQVFIVTHLCYPRVSSLTIDRQARLTYH